MGGCAGPAGRAGARASQVSVSVSGFRAPRLDGPSWVPHTERRFLRDYGKYCAHVAQANGNGIIRCLLRLAELISVVRTNYLAWRHLTQRNKSLTDVPICAALEKQVG